MAHWKNEQEAESDDETSPPQAAVNARRWLRAEVSRRVHTDPLYGMLADLELAASPYYLGQDYDDDTDDVDEMGPF